MDGALVVSSSWRLTAALREDNYLSKADAPWSFTTV